MIVKIIDCVLLRPIMLLFQVSYNIINDLNFPNYITLFILSLVINIIILPLYLRAEAIQTEEIKKENLIKDKVAHINKYFKGDEKLLILNALYKQNGYSRFDMFKSVLPLILEIPFFICAYRILSSNLIFEKHDLGIFNVNVLFPDRLLLINDIHINIFPIIMTIINIISVVVYCKKNSYKKNLFLLIIPLVFFILLYNSPSGLVLYWIYNNLFSLVKNIICRFVDKSNFNRNFDINNKYKYSYKKTLFLLFFNLIFFSLFIPLRCIYILSTETEIANAINEMVVNNFLIEIFAMYFGIFVFWSNIIFLFLNEKGRFIYQKILEIFTFYVIVKYSFFSIQGYVFDNELSLRFVKNENICLITISFILIVALAFYIISLKKQKILYIVLSVLFIALFVSIFNYSIRIYSTNKINEIVEHNGNTNNKLYKLSTKGKNVIIIMIDNALGMYIPYIFKEKPELKTAYSGFKYYSNVVTYASFTILTLPTIFGGYEYTPVEMNKRKNDKNADKIFEAYSVLPMVFKNNDFNTSIIDISEHINLKKGLTKIITNKKEVTFLNASVDKFIMFTFMMMTPRIIQPYVYNSGKYLCSTEQQLILSNYKAKGKPTHYINEHEALNSLIESCEINDGIENNYMSLVNGITHGPYALLQTPDYLIKDEVDNTEYYINNYENFNYNGSNILDKNNGECLPSYNVMVGALMSISKFINYMKQNNVYDNTRIIIVSDHGFRFNDLDYKYFSNKNLDIMPLLMIKDFNSVQFSEDSSFMTIADVPTMALKDIVDNPINPFTGKMINDSEKTSHKQMIYAGDYYNVRDDDSNIIRPGKWFSIHDNIYDYRNWAYTEDSHVLYANELPINDEHYVENIINMN